MSAPHILSPDKTPRQKSLGLDGPPRLKSSTAGLLTCPSSNTSSPGFLFVPTRSSLNEVPVYGFECRFGYSVRWYPPDHPAVPFHAVVDQERVSEILDRVVGQSVRGAPEPLHRLPR